MASSGPKTWDGRVVTAVTRMGDAVATALPDGETARRLGVWLELLQTWNARMDLTAAKGDQEILDVMIADAAVLAAQLPRGEGGRRLRVVDVGSGAGAPGLPLAIWRPDLDLTLVEPLTKRQSFLRTVTGTLGLDVHLLRARGEDLVAQGQTFDVAISRATLPPPQWLTVGASLVVPGGATWLLLAGNGGETLEAPPQLRLEKDVTYTWPGSGAPRCARVYRRVPSP